MESELGGGISAVAGHSEGGEDGAGDDDMLCVGAGAFPLAREEPGMHHSSGYFGGAKVVNVHYHARISLLVTQYLGI